MTHRPGRWQRLPRHPRCPSHVFYPDRASGDEAAARLGSLVETCTAGCGGFRMTLVAPVPAVTAPAPTTAPASHERESGVAS